MCTKLPADRKRRYRGAIDSEETSSQPSYQAPQAQSKRPRLGGFIDGISKEEKEEIDDLLAEVFYSAGLPLSLVCFISSFAT